MSRRHVHAAGERLDVERLRVVPVDPVADAAQPREVAQARAVGGGQRTRIKTTMTAMTSAAMAIVRVFMCGFSF
jgi:hypothetical protein